NIGNNHINGVIVFKEGYRTYLLNRKYSQFKGTVALHYRNRSTAGKSIMKIYGDDKLLYTSPVFTGGVYPDDFNVDVSGVILIEK
ncbi:MAG TPA: NPCBM/NEW2 domain-containing protein, partial [Syntrophomonadaceae bacterium]|nr:NPCBM/NEW2 domain-containing protein [Syntrophomonadaceae bacterium]